MNASEKAVALITGASPGMGKGVALRLIEEDHHVYCGARRVDRIEENQAGGLLAGPLLFMRRFLFDRLFGRLIPQPCDDHVHELDD